MRCCNVRNDQIRWPTEHDMHLTLRVGPTSEHPTKIGAYSLSLAKHMASLLSATGKKRNINSQHRGVALFHSIFLAPAHFVKPFKSHLTSQHRGVRCSGYVCPSGEPPCAASAHRLSSTLYDVTNRLWLVLKTAIVLGSSVTAADFTVFASTCRCCFATAHCWSS